MRPLLLLLPLTLTAADLKISDLRIEVGAGEVSNYEAEYRYKSGPLSMSPSGTYKSTDYDGSAPLAISALYSQGSLSPFGFVWAAGVEYQASDEEIAGESFGTDMIGAKVRAGIGWTPAESWRLEATAEGHLGYIRAEDADITDGSDLDRSEADGSYSAIGLQLGVGYVLKERWEIGASFRVLAYRADTEADFDVTGGSYEATVEWLLWSASLSAGYRF